MSVPIHLVGSEDVKEGVLSQTLNELEIETDATNVPTDFQISVSEMAIGDSVTVADIAVDSGITVLTDAEEAVAVLSAPAAEEAAATEEVATSESEAVTE